MSPVRTCIVQVKMNLPDVGMSEPADLEIDDNETAQSSVIKNEIDSVPLVTDS